MGGGRGCRRILRTRDRARHRRAAGRPEPVRPRAGRRGDMTMADRPTVDFDHHTKEFHDNRHAEWASLRQCPVAFNPNYGGFWVVSGYDEVATVSRDGETFSSRYGPSDDDID